MLSISILTSFRLWVAIGISCGTSSLSPQMLCKKHNSDYTAFCIHLTFSTLSWQNNSMCPEEPDVGGLASHGLHGVHTVHLGQSGHVWHGTVSGQVWHGMVSGHGNGSGHIVLP